MFLVLVAIGAVDVRREHLFFGTPDRPHSIVLSRHLFDLWVQYSGLPAKTDPWKSYMEQVISTYRQTHGNHGLVEKVHQFMNVAAASGLTEKGGQPLDTEGTRRWLLPFVRRDQELWRAWTQLCPDDATAQFDPETVPEMLE